MRDDEWLAKIARGHVDHLKRRIKFVIKFCDSEIQDHRNMEVAMQKHGVKPSAEVSETLAILRQQVETLRDQLTAATRFKTGELN
jgi:polyhydroxyalkanoate synthesis regulator phasin